MHQSVLLSETVQALKVQPQGIYVDATFGRGGHSRAILQQLGPKGRLIVFDQDPEAICYAQEHFGEDARVQIVASNFEHLAEHLDALQIPAVDGMLFDLGVSSPQLDAGERGFSFLKPGPLDMRMNPAMGLSCQELLLQIDVNTLTRILKDYGEERFAGRIARAVVARQTKAPLTRTEELAALIRDSIPKSLQEAHKHPATRTFQALRIYLNRELEVLEQVLLTAPWRLKIGGRAVFISFHSLEDRLVKQALQRLCQPRPVPRGLPIKTQAEDLPPFKLYIKMHKPDQAEINNNVRARSAVMRAVERIR